MTKCDERIQKKLAGPIWNNVRKKILSIIELLLEVDKSSVAELATIYIKFKIKDEPRAPVYAVLWIRPANQVVLGLATPKKIANERVIDAPPRKKYPLLTSYIRISENDEIPPCLNTWVRDAFQNAKRPVVI